MKHDSPRYNRRSVRLKHYDYSQAGIYFVTLCTHNRVLFFDDPVLRELAGTSWEAIPDHADGVGLEDWVVMPNHLHGLLVLAESPVPANRPPLDSPGSSVPVEAGRVAGSMISPKGNLLAVVVRTYKAAVTTACRRIGRADFRWQRGYYEHVVRQHDELENIRRYIHDNPQQWTLDHDNPSTAVAHRLPRRGLSDASDW